MKRLLQILLAAACSTMAVGTMRHETSFARASAFGLRNKEHLAAMSLAELKLAGADLQQGISKLKGQRTRLSEASLDPQLADWLLGGDYRSISDSLLPKLSGALGLQWAEPTNFVLVAKSSLHKFGVCYNAGANLLGDWDCGILSITPEERQQIESACAATRERFADWARANYQRTNPGGNTLLRYTIPTSPELAQSLTNTLYSAINDAIGPERAPLLWEYKQYWFGLELGHFGSVDNTLLITRNPIHPEQPDLWYAAEGHGGPVVGEPGYGTYGTFSNIFGGLPEILAREGIEIPREPSNPPATN